MVPMYKEKGDKCECSNSMHGTSSFISMNKFVEC